MQVEQRAKDKQKKIKVPIKKPRNPLVAPAMKRKAGKHNCKKRIAKQTHNE